MNNCGACKHWNPRNPRGLREMVERGFALCDLGVTYTYLAPHHSCPQFKAADAEISAGRVEWLRRMDAKRAAAC